MLQYHQAYLHRLCASGNRPCYEQFRHLIGSRIKKQCMKLSEALLKKLAKKYEPSAMVQARFRGNDLLFKTDESGNAMQLFIGKMKDDGTIKGERFARTLLHDKDGKAFKDHWDRKGTTH